MTDGRTTINMTKEAHRAAGDVKDEYDESWTDVLLFYAEHRGDLALAPNTEPTHNAATPDEVTLDGGVISDIANETARKTAEELEGRLR